MTARIRGFGRAAFVLVDGIGGAIDVVEFKDGPDTRVRKRPGRAAYDAVTLRRARAGRPLLWAWWKACVNGEGERRSVTLTLKDASERSLATWTLGGCWPTRWRLVYADSDEKHAGHVEEVTLVVEDIQLG